MTLLAILAALVGGWFWVGAHQTSVISGELTVYVAIFIIGLATATVASLIAWTPRLVAAAGVLIIHFAATHYSWQLSDPVLAIAVADVVAAAYFILLGQSRWEWAIGLLFLAGVGNAALTALGAIPGPFERPPVYLAWNFADLSSLVGNLASAILGLGAGDWGKRIRDGLRSRPAWLGTAPNLLMRVLH